LSNARGVAKKYAPKKPSPLSSSAVLTPPHPARTTPSVSVSLLTPPLISITSNVKFALLTSYDASYDKGRIFQPAPENLRDDEKVFWYLANHDYPSTKSFLESHPNMDLNGQYREFDEAQNSIWSYSPLYFAAKRLAPYFVELLLSYPGVNPTLSVAFFSSQGQNVFHTDAVMATTDAVLKAGNFYLLLKDSRVKISNEDLAKKKLLDVIYYNFVPNLTIWIASGQFVPILEPYETKVYSTFSFGALSLYNQFRQNPEATRTHCQKMVEEYKKGGYTLA
jgi:hypothetical protein